MVAAIIEFVVSTSFCTRPAPAVIRRLLMLGIGVIGARLLTRDNASLDIDAWFVVGLWAFLAVIESISAGFAVYSILPPNSDTCRRDEKRETNMWKAAVLLAMLSLLMYSTAGAQENSDEGGNSAEFEVIVGDFAYPLDPRDPVQGCVLSSTANQDGETTITYRLFVREQATEGPIFNSVGIYTDDADGFPEVEVGDCFGVGGRITNG
jgi:hypothetical protein